MPRRVFVALLVVAIMPISSFAQDPPAREATGDSTPLQSAAPHLVDTEAPFPAGAAALSVAGTPPPPLAAVVAAQGTAGYSGASALAASDPRHSVVPTGAFSYTYPIELPPGTNGVAPSLSLSYNSAGGYGMIGMGFQLTGLPAIERDPSYPITFTANDHYMYQGVKLVYASSDGRFHPERETFERFQAYGSDSEAAMTSNPNSATSHWVLLRKDGSKLYFGSTDDSRIDAVGKGGLPRLWALSRVEDVNGNYYTVHYGEDTANGDHYPTRIVYTQGNGLAAFKAVLFSYEILAVHYPVYAPTRIDADQFLRWITVSIGADGDGNGGSTIRRYRIDYVEGSSTGRLRVAAIRVFGSDGTSTLPAVAFQWQDKAAGFAPAQDWGNPESAAWNLRELSKNPGDDGTNEIVSDLLDMNGDGIMDRVWKAGGPISVALNRPGGPLLRAASWGDPEASAWDLRQTDNDEDGVNETVTDLLDMNGDGLPDRVWKNSGPLHVALNTGSGFSPEQSWGEPDPLPWNLREYTKNPGDDGTNELVADFVDMNGDGLLDRVSKNGGPVRVALNTGTGLAPAGNWGGDPDPAPWDLRQHDNDDFGTNQVVADLLDMTGDGLPDRVWKALGPLMVAPNTGSVFSSAVDWGDPDPYPWNLREYTVDEDGGSETIADLVDMNGDGLPDRVWKHDGSDGGQIGVALNTGAGFAPARSWGNPDPFAWSLREQTKNPGDDGTNEVVADLLDMNGDGLPDRVWQAGGPLYVAVNNGSGFYPAQSWGDPDPGSWDLREQDNDEDGVNESVADLVDMNSDGLLDRVWKNSGNLFVAMSLGSQPDVMTNVALPGGGTISVTYAPACQLNGVVLASPATYPVIANTRPRLLVTRVVADNRYGEFVRTRYSYEEGRIYAGLRADRTDLGFRKISKTVEGAGTGDVIVFRQDKPYHGLVERTYTAAWGAATEGAKYVERVNTYAYSAKVDPRIRFLYLAETMSRVYDGQASSWDTRTSYQYGEHGDVTETWSYGTIVVEPSGAIRDVGTADNIKTETAYVASSSAYVVRPQSTKVSRWGASGGFGLESRTDYYYDGSSVFGSILKGLLTRADRYTDGANSVRATVEHDPNGNPRYLYDGRGHRTELTYDTYQTLIRTTTNPLLHTETVHYDAYGRADSVTDANNQVTSTVYDVFGRPIQIIRPYDFGSSPTVLVDRGDTAAPMQFPRWVHTLQLEGTGYLERYDYFDGLGRLIQSKTEGATPGQWNTVDHYYDAAGRNHKTSVPYFTINHTFTTRDTSQRRTERQYDALGRVIRTIHPDTTSTQILFQKTKTTSVDANGHVASREVNTDDVRITYERRYTGTYPLTTLYSTVTTRSYLGLKEVVDNAGNTISIYTDMLGQKRTYVDPDKGTWSYAYDENGNLSTQTDALGQTTTFEYDWLNRVTRKDYPSGSDAAYTYDAGPNGIGRLASVSFSRGQDTYGYDARGRMTSITRVLDGISRSLSYTYDSSDRVVTTGYPGGEAVTSSYGSDGNLVSLIGESAYASSIVYDSLYRIAGMTYGNGIGTAYDYYDSGGEVDPYLGAAYAFSYRLRQIRAGPSGSPSAVLSLTYGYDKAGNVKTKTDANAASYSETYSYDALGRLIAATGSYGSLSFAYNQIDNITSKDGLPYAYGAKPHAVIARGGATYAYDANGNMTNWNGPTIGYDAAGRTVSISGLGGGTFSYADGTERTIKEEGTKTTYYFFPVYEEEYTSGSLSRTVKYYLVNGQPVAQRSSGIDGLQYLHSDHLGSSVRMTNADGSMAFQGGYRPYGEDAYVTGTPTTRYRFTGQEREANTLYYYGARYYDPVLGRFLQADSVLDGINRYAYCYNNPIKYVDPTGHIPGIFTFLIGTAVVAFVTWIINEVIPDDAREWISEHVAGEINITVPIEIAPTGGGETNDSGEGGAGGGSQSSGTHYTNPEITPYSMAQQGTLPQGLEAGGGSDGGVLRRGGKGLAIGLAGWWALMMGYNMGGGGGGGGGRDRDNDLGRGDADMPPEPGPGGGGDWRYGHHKSAQTWANQMRQRGWTEEQITEAIQTGQPYRAVNNVNPLNSATRYVHPTTGQSVVVDDVTGELLQVGGQGFQW